jgi:hypothetical protein
MRACRIAEASVGGIESLVLENEHLEVVVLVGKGTDIFSFRHRASGTDFLWKAPWGVRDPATTIQDTANSAASFLDYYFGGWQELFPNAGAGCTYRGAELGVHGEACKVPWSWQITEETSRRISVRFRARMVRTPFLLEKQMTLEAGRAVLLIEETVTNEGADAVDFIWGHHPALGAPFLSGHCRLYTPARVVETDDSNLFLAPRRRFESYPMIETVDGAPFDVSRIPPSSARVTMQSFLRELAEGWYALVNQESGLGFALSWDLEVFPYLWLWEELCGSADYPWWGRCYVAGIEPNSTPTGGGLAEAVENGTQHRLPPGKSLHSILCATAFETQGEPRRVDPEGRIEY